MTTTTAGNRRYEVHRPVAAFAAGAAVAVLAGLIGLGGAEFRLPLLILVFALYAHRAVRINLLISLATLAAASIVRLQLIPDLHLEQQWKEIAALSLGGVAAAWVGAGALERIPKDRMVAVISALLAITAAILMAETLLADTDAWSMQPQGTLRMAVALCAGLLIGALSSLLGVAGGEFIIPTLVLAFGFDIRAAGTASVLISLPIVIAGVTRHFFAGRFRSRSMLGYLVLPMSLGSIAGAVVGGYLSIWIPGGALRLLLAAILAVSAWKLWRKRAAVPEDRRLPRST